jgi:hypothetical protein
MICACSFNSWMSIIFSSWDSIVLSDWGCIHWLQLHPKNMVLVCYLALVPSVLFATVLKSIVLVFFILLD